MDDSPASSASAASVEVATIPEPDVVASDVADSSDDSRSVLRRFGLTDLDAILAVLAAWLVVAFVPALVAPNWTPRFAAVIGVVPAGIAVLWLDARRRVWPAVAALLLVVWATISAVMAPDWAVSLKGAIGHEHSVVMLTGCFGVWALARRVTDQGARLIHLVAVGALAACAIVGVIQVAMDIRIGPLAMLDGRANGLTTHAVYYGALVAAGVALSAWRLGRDRWWAWASLILLFGVGVGLSASRVAFVAGVVGLALCARNIGAKSTSLASGAFLAGFALSNIIPRGQSTLDRAGETGGAIGVRVDLWRYGLDAAVEKPLFGWGLGNFRDATQGRYTREFTMQHARNDIAPWFDAHNLVVELLVALGFVGLLLGGVFAAHTIMSARGPLAVAAATIAVTWALEPAALATLPLAALLLGAAMREGEVAALPSQRWFVGLAAAGALLTLALFVADLRLDRAIDGGDTGQIEAAAAWFWRDPVAADVVSQSALFDALDDSAQIPAAVSWAERPTEFDPQRPAWWEKLAGRYFLADRFDDAEAAIRRSIDLQPHRPAAWSLLLEIGNSLGRDELVAEATEELCLLGTGQVECD